MRYKIQPDFATMSRENSFPLNPLVFCFLSQLKLSETLKAKAGISVVLNFQMVCSLCFFHKVLKQCYGEPPMPWLRHFGPTSSSRFDRGIRGKLRLGG